MNGAGAAILFPSGRVFGKMIDGQEVAKDIQARFQIISEPASRLVPKRRVQNTVASGILRKIGVYFWRMRQLQSWCFLSPNTFFLRPRRFALLASDYEPNSVFRQLGES